MDPVTFANSVGCPPAAYSAMQMSDGTLVVSLVYYDRYQAMRAWHILRQEFPDIAVVNTSGTWEIWV